MVGRKAVGGNGKGCAGGREGTQAEDRVLSKPYANLADFAVMMQIVDKTIMEADKDRDGKISFEEFTKMVENTDVSMSMTLGKF